MKDGSRVRTVRFEAPVYIAELHPSNQSVVHFFLNFGIINDIPATSLLFVASLFEEQPVLVDLSSTKPVKRILPSTPLRPRNEEVTAKQAAQDAKQSTCVTIFTGLGSHIIAGTSRGWINLIETRTCRTLHSTRLCNGVVILLRLSNNGRDLVVNSSDRVIRTIVLPDLSQLGSGDDDEQQPSNFKLQVEHKFQDVVNRLSWNDVAFSSLAGDFIIASTFMNPDIYVWERSHGSLVKILEGPREELGVVEWHPFRPMVVACGLESGCIYTWSVVSPQKWSALAPDFAEVEENVPYIEHEDEFDIQPAEEVHQRRLDQEDEVPDVLTVELAEDEVDSSADDDSFCMPVLLDISDGESEDDIIAVGPGTMRKRSPGAGRDWMINDDNDMTSAGGQTNGTDSVSRGRGSNRGRRR